MCYNAHVTHVTCHKYQVTQVKNNFTKHPVCHTFLERSCKIQTNYNTTQHKTTQHNAAQHNTTQHDTAQHNTTTKQNKPLHDVTQYKKTTCNKTQHNIISCRQLNVESTFLLYYVAAK